MRHCNGSGFSFKNQYMNTISKEATGWKNYEKAGFRIAFIYFFLQAFPLDWKYYQQIFSTNFLRFQDLFQLTTYFPRLLPSAHASGSFADWGILLALAVAGGLTWGYFDRDKKDYNQLFYWLRVLLRYRLAIGLIGYGMIKLFPIQIPEPTISDLNTPYGDFLPWKIYYLTTGSGKALYEPVLGSIEIAAALLLLFRKTATFGAAIATAVLINIAVANFAYLLGDAVYSAYLLVIAIFLLAYDLPRLFNLLALFRFTRANKFHPAVSGRILRAGRILKLALLAFVLLYTGTVYAAYKHQDWPFPVSPGLADAAGYYTVTKYSVNDSALPYSLIDSERWQNVVFEKWNTVSIRKSIPVPINSAPAHSIYANDEFSYESIGNGGRYFYTYTHDTANHLLRLHGKSVPGDSTLFSYFRPDDVTIVLSGKNNRNDSVHIVLEKLNKKYLLHEGRRNPAVPF